jgi:hypothetical protein
MRNHRSLNKYSDFVVGNANDNANWNANGNAKGNANANAKHQRLWLIATDRYITVLSDIRLFEC